MDFVLMGAAGSIGSGMYNAMAMPPMGHVDIPTMPNVNLPTLPTVTMPSFPTMTPVTSQFGTGVGQIVDGVVGSNSLIGPGGMYPFTNPFPGYSPTGQIGVNPFVGIPSALSSAPMYEYQQMLQGQQGMGTGYMGPLGSNPVNPTYQNGAFYVNSLQSARMSSFGYCNPFMSAQCVGNFGAFYGGMRGAFSYGRFC